MAYTATKWNDGDLITAEKLNKLEQGVAQQQIGRALTEGRQGRPRGARCKGGEGG